MSHHLFPMPRVLAAAMLASGCAPSTEVANALEETQDLARADRHAVGSGGIPPVVRADPPAVLRIGPEVAQTRFEEIRDRFGVATRRLVELSYEEKIWADEAPSSNSHRLLECGASCRKLNGTGSLVEWWASATDSGQLHQLHRGEFLAVFARSGGSPLHRIQLDEEQWISASALLQEGLAETLSDTPAAWNKREQTRGLEHGWLLQAACRYHGASMGLDAAEGRELLAAAVESAGRAATEAGTHELEGLSLCLSAHRDAPALQLAASYEEVSETLEDAQMTAFSRMRDDGQLYVEAQTFDGCTGETCEVLAALSKQAHFFEWTAIGPSVELDDEMLVALSRLETLATDAVEVLEGEFASPGPQRRWLPLFASASSHSAHVMGHFARWQQPSNAPVAD